MLSSDSKTLDSGLPRVAVGAIVRRNDSYLLVKRANNPNRGRWSIPGGKVLPGESLQVAVEREVLEETSIIVQAFDPIFTFDLIEHDGSNNLLYHYVIVDLVARYIRGEIMAGTDALEAVWAHEQELDKYDLNADTLRLFREVS
ncbi:NUDIX hydrolase [Desulfonatronovibrio magnus]|uniref:NUDIX hydrolase n=1 Tax=Desulfonatronovibrio magnus TaxID=698827 RepID=UPI0005EB726F|nr:NUDIX hydrolase [Desulfonatronovibrio magnus]RQD55690.1 MAG: NUDIX domain-containing protein [Desulfonatronovibrio sp. MSAO_Bac4]